MNSNTITVSELEVIYDALAEGLDRAGDGMHSLYLTKLVLILSEKLNSKEVVLQAMDDALADL